MNKREREAFYWRIAENVRAYRHRRGVSQEALAGAAHLTRASINNMEAGRQHLQMHTLQEIADFLEVPMWRLLK